MSSETEISAVVADDHAIVRTGLVLLFEKRGRIRVLGEAEDGATVVRLAEKHRPDVVIMDLMMPGMDGAEATRQIREKCPETRVLILTSFGESADLARAVHAGASGVLLKDSPTDDLLRAIRTVAAGGECFSKEIRALLSEVEEEVDLTDRQRELLSLVARGFTNAEIGRQLNISEDGVKKTLRVVFPKIGATNRAEATSIALRRGLVR